MAYKIEDIDWDKMPEGAVEFSLEDDDYTFCWYNKNEESTDLCGVMGWGKFDDSRERHKVSDYHPSTPTNRKLTREERLEQALRAIVFEGMLPLADMSPNLHKEIVDLLG